MPSADGRIPVLYIAPWVDVGASDTGTIDWFRALDQTRFRASLITTQPSPNRRLHEVMPFADEVWDLPEMMTGDQFANFILTYVRTREIAVVHMMDSRLAFELLPELARLTDRPRIVVQLHLEEPDQWGYVRYVASRFGTLVDAFSVSSQALSDQVAAYDIPRVKRRVIPTGAETDTDTDTDTELEFCPQRVADEHADLYDELLSKQTETPRAAPAPAPGSPSRPAVAFRNRRPGTTPLVSVIVPCFDHGCFLEKCLGSIAEQTYEHIEVIVVDDGSTDPETLDALTRAQLDGITVVRLAANQGPSVARNVGLDHARGRYILPVDADNLLLPGAIEALVTQLGSAGEQIGFIYPNCQFFGNRTDYVELPSYNLHSQLSLNACDTSSLFDREVFDRGFRYAEDIVLGHEDWDLALTLAEHGIYGEVAQDKTLLYRKHGFTRSDLVNNAPVSFAEILERRHPALFAPGSRARLKGEWNPAVSVVAVDPLTEPNSATFEALIAAAESQSCEDFELIVRAGDDVASDRLGRRLRRIPSTLADSRAEALAHGVAIARGRWILALYGPPADVLGDRSMIEKLLRALTLDPHVRALALADDTDEHAAFALLDRAGAQRAALLGVGWEAVGASAPPPSLVLGGDRPLEQLARWLAAHHGLQWRQLRRSDPPEVAIRRTRPDRAIGAPRLARARDGDIRNVAPALPGASPELGRTDPASKWSPPHSRLLCRHLDRRTGRYLYTNSVTSPPCATLEFVLGHVRALPLAGTVSLTLRDEDGELAVALGETVDLDAPQLIGFLEEAPLPLFEMVSLARHRVTGQRVLIAGGDDPLGAHVDVIRPLGHVEPSPIHPRQPPHLDIGYGLVGLIRSIDHGHRRHRYGAGGRPAGELAGELGALYSAPIGACEPVWIDAQGQVRTAGLPTLEHRPALAAATRWAYDPLTWRNFSSPGPKLRATARRAIHLPRLYSARPVTAADRGEPAGYLAIAPGPRTVPLFAAVHPVTGDQLLATRRSEFHGIGYREPRLLGYLVASAPVTGTLGITHAGVPWAARFGVAAPIP